MFSGGTATNHLVDVFNEIATKRQDSLSYIIPISDNGGSSSELIRVFGGPGIGDVRSMLQCSHAQTICKDWKRELQRFPCDRLYVYLTHSGRPPRASDTSVPY